MNIGLRDDLMTSSSGENCLLYSMVMGNISKFSKKINMDTNTVFMDIKKIFVCLSWLVDSW
jgi:hypothetical protein